MNLNAARILEALAFAAEQHKFQRRAGYEPLPYINHLIKVTEALINIGKETDDDLIIAAILHDLMEDTPVSKKEIADMFGQTVAEVIEELTDDMTLSYSERKRQQIITAVSLSKTARKIRIADKASNLEDIFTYDLDWSQMKKWEYLENAVQVVDQIRGTNEKLEKWFDTVVEGIKQSTT